MQKMPTDSSVSAADTCYMHRCLALARKGAGHVSPNPMVGAVLVHNGRIIGEGYHAQYGGPHAEINAINQVRDREVLQASTLYVNLEPCAHHGQTPPCSTRIIQEGIPQVVIGCQDDNAQVQGKGIRQMKEAGITVTTGVLEQEARWLNRRFFTYHQKQRPYIILKWAQTADGFMADKRGNSKWISNPYSRIYVHKWRHEEDAIMVGYGTIKQDDPALTARAWQGRHPVRLALDRNLSINSDYQLYADGEPTWWFNEEYVGESGNNSFFKLDKLEHLKALTGVLYDKRITSVLVEGGVQVLSHLIEQGYWDEARVFTAPVQMQEGLAAPEIQGEITGLHQIGSDALKIMTNQ